MILRASDDLFGVRGRHPAWCRPQRVFQADADIAAHGGSHRRDRELIAAGAQHRPDHLVAEQPVGGALHVQHVLRVRAGSALQAEHRLHE